MAAVRPVTPERVAPVTGVPAATIRRLAREPRDCSPRAVYGRLGVTQSVYGTPGVLARALPQRRSPAGSTRIGGVMFSTPAFDLPTIGARTTDLIGYDRWRSRVRGIPEFAAEFPVATLADEILTPGEGQVRAMVLYAGNPVLSAPDGARLESALENLEFVVAVDYYVTESTRHADVILPPTSPFERDEFDVVFPAVSVHNWVRWSPAAVPAPEGSCSDADILLGAARTRVASYAEDPAYAAAREQRLPRAVPEAVRRSRRCAPAPTACATGRSGLTLAKVMRAEHGLDLGPLVRQLPRRLMTERPPRHARPPGRDGRLAARARRARGRARLRPGRRHRPAHGRATAPAQQQLVDAQQRAAHQGAHTVSRCRCTRTTRRREVSSTATPRSSAPTSAASRPPSRSTDRLMPGVVSVPHGYGHDRAGSPTGWRHAAVARRRERQRHHRHAADRPAVGQRRRPGRAGAGRTRLTSRRGRVFLPA